MLLKYDKLLIPHNLTVVRAAKNEILLKQRLLKVIAQHTKVLKKAADTLGISEHVAAERISKLKHSDFFNLTNDQKLQKLLSAIISDENTKDILDDYERLKKYEGRMYPQKNKHSSS